MHFRILEQPPIHYSPFQILNYRFHSYFASSSIAIVHSQSLELNILCNTKISYVYIVSNACSIQSWVIISENGQTLSFPNHDFLNQREEIIWRRERLISEQMS